MQIWNNEKWSLRYNNTLNVWVRWMGRKRRNKCNATESIAHTISTDSRNVCKQTTRAACVTLQAIRVYNQSEKSETETQQQAHQYIESVKSLTTQTEKKNNTPRQTICKLMTIFC